MAFSLIFTFTARFCYNLWRDRYDRSFDNKSWQRNDSKNYLDSITRLERYLKIVLRTVPPFKANRIVHKCCDVIYSLLFFFFYFILHSFYQIFRLLFCLPFFLASFFLFFFFMLFVLYYFQFDFFALHLSIPVPLIVRSLEILAFSPPLPLLSPYTRLTVPPKPLFSCS